MRHAWHGQWQPVLDLTKQLLVLHQLELSREVCQACLPSFPGLPTLVFDFLKPKRLTPTGAHDDER